VKPTAAVDSCFDVSGNLIASGDGVWNGILDGGAKGACAQQFPPFGTSRTVAGGPIEGGVFKCALQPVEQALGNGLYGAWTPSGSELARLTAIFPTGVCDYSQPDLGLPPELSGK
jgi:hypothetical protein